MLLFILLVSAAVRLWRVDSLITIGGDIGYDLLKIKGIIGGDWTLLGPPIGRFGDSVLYLGPLYYYLQVPFLFLFKLDPLGMMVPIIAARVTTTLFVYLAAKTLFNKQAALVAAVISGVSPYFKDMLGPPSPPYLIPAIVSIIIFLLVKNPKSAKTFALMGFVSGLSVHLHYLGLSVFLALLLFILSEKTPAFMPEKKRILSEEERTTDFRPWGSIFYGANQKIKKTAAIFAGFFLSISPLVLFEARNNFFLSKQIIDQLTAGVASPEAPLLTDKIVSLSNFLAVDITGFALPVFASFILIIASFAYALKNAKDKPAIFFLSSIVVINLVAVGLYKQAVQPHYLASVYVPLFILAGAIIFSLARFGKALPLALTLIVTFALISANDLNRASGYTMPEDLTLRQIRQISKIIASDASGQFNIVSTLDGDSRALPYRYLVDTYGKQPLDHQTYDRGDSLYIITRDPPKSTKESALFEIASFQPSFLENSWNINGDIKLIKLSKHERLKPESPKFITIASPVRPRNLWNDQSLGVIESQMKSIDNRDLKSTWLLSYENLFDQEIVDFFKSQKGHEIGAYLEVSEKWATDSHVVYKIAEGDYYRPDKVFLSGYSPKDREKLIKTLFLKFQQVFASTPKSVGAWYIDANSQNLLSALGVTSALTVADQFDTDAASIWGKYWGMPFYPSKLNSLAPAKSQSEKLPIVNLQWAQRDLVAGYGREIKDSRQSFQANDYINNGYSTTYFVDLLENYLTNAQDNDFMQITIGLEAGQEAQRFAEEFERQLDVISQKQKSNEAKAVTMGEFANWYRGKYPGISPSHLLAKGESFWYMSPKFRVAIFKENDAFKIKDLRYFDQSIFDDYYYSDSQPYLKRNIPHLVDDVSVDNEIDLGRSENLEQELHFDRLILKLDNRVVRIDERGVEVDGKNIVARQTNNYQKGHEKKTVLTKIRSTTIDLLNVFRYSVIDGHRIFGLLTSGTTVVGFRDFVPGVYKYDFQVAARFLSLAKIIEGWRP